MISKLELQIQLSNLFHIGFNFITAENTPKPKWRTNRKYRLTRGEFVKRHSDELILLGVSFGATTKYFMLDIDKGSQYHPDNDITALPKLRQLLEQVGIVRTDLIRSSHSGGIHLYGCLPKNVSTIRLATLLHVTFIDAGMQITKGQLECFPNPKPYGEKGHYTYYNPHRVALQPNSGSLLLDQDGEILLNAENLTHENMLAGFLARTAQSAQAQDMELLSRMLDTCYAKYTSNKGIAKYQHHHKDYTEVAREWKENLELTIQTVGWTANGQTNTLLPNFIAYGVVFLGLKGEELKDCLHDLILAAPGYYEYCRHKHEIKAVIKGWVENTERQGYYVEYCGFPARSGLNPHTTAKRIRANRNQHNHNLAKRTEQRLNAILAALTEIPKQVTAKIAAIRTKSIELFGEAISRNTLYKPEYKPLWFKTEIAKLDSSLEKDPIPPLDLPLTNTDQQFQPIFNRNNLQNLAAQTQPEHTLSHTPPLYETYGQQSGSQKLHHYLHSYCINLFSQFILILGFLAYQLDSGVDQPNSKSLAHTLEPQSLFIDHTLTTNSNESKTEVKIFSLDLPESELHPESLEITEPAELVEQFEDVDSEQASLISVGTKLRRNIQQVGKKSYPALPACVVVSSNGLDWVVRDPDGFTWNVSQHSLATGLWEIETSIDALELLAGGLPDPQNGSSALNTRSVVEVARAVRANISGIDDELLLEFLHHPQQTEIQELIELADELVAAQTCDSVQRVVSNLCRREKIDLWRVLGVEERSVVETLMAAVVPVSSVAVEPDFTAGVVVTTLTGLIGVIRHVFQSVAKPFVVYHEELNRTIRYDLDDLRFNA
jgi:hypothetical protein